MTHRSLIAGALAACVLAATPAFAQQLELTGTLRDFSKNHPDMQRPASGFGLVTGMVADTLGSDGKPVLNAGGAVSNSVTAGVDSEDNFQITVTFDDGGIAFGASVDLTWLRMYFTDGTSQKFSSVAASGELAIPAGKTISQVKARAYPGGVRRTKTLDAPSASGIPEIWRIESVDTFNQWFRNVEGVNRSVNHTIVLDDSDGDGVYRFEASKHNGQSFFPLDGKLFGNEGNSHNYHFTYEIKTKFTYTDPTDRDPLVFRFSGDDDVWVFINDKLVVDIGGVHAEQFGSVDVDAIADQLGLVPGKTYDFHFFFAERYLVESNCTIETTIQFLSPLYD